MEIVKLKPAIKDYLWGGTTFFHWGKVSQSQIISECWELSFHQDGLSCIDSGIDSGKALKDIVKSSDLGSKCTEFPSFPLLIKLIDSNKDLSIQVHPSDEDAQKKGYPYGKSELWYIIEVQKDACLYIGFNKDVSKGEVKEAIANGTLMNLLNRVEVKPNQAYFIPAKTIHAIGKGVTLLEIQQNSNLTYRVFDYNRLDKNNQPRRLDIADALDVLDFHKMTPSCNTVNPLGSCKYFTSSYYQDEQTVQTDDLSFSTITFIEGSGLFADIPFKKGDTFFIPANKSAQIIGRCKYIVTKV